MLMSFLPQPIVVYLKKKKPANLDRDPEKWPVQGDSKKEFDQMR
jgi:hypothetical protein